MRESSSRAAIPMGIAREFLEEGVLTASNERGSGSRLPAAQVDGETMLELGRMASEDSLEQLRQYAPQEIAAALLELVPAQRVEFLELAERLDEIVPLLPETEFTSMLRGAGIEESGWLVEFASPEQRIASIDLDCWQDFRFSPSRLFEWIDAMIDAGPETLAAAFGELDREVWVLAMKEMGDFSIAGLGNTSAGGGMTVDGIVFYDAHTAESEERIREILSTALLYAPSHYWGLVYGAISENATESQELAARWQRNRLGDLGFPDREQAMRAYQPLKVEQASVMELVVEAEPGAVASAASQVPVQLSGSLLGRALAELPPERSIEVMNYILAVANTLAVADKLPLTESDTVERSLAKARRGIDRGLAEMARARNQPLGAILNSTPPLDLFRIGATLDPELRSKGTLSKWMEEQQRADWNVESELISEADRTVGSDGRLR